MAGTRRGPCTVTKCHDTNNLFTNFRKLMNSVGFKIIIVIFVANFTND